jgi:hypothetical protein
MIINGQKIEKKEWNRIKHAVFPSSDKPVERLCNHHTELNGPQCGKPATKGVIWGVFKVTPYCENHLVLLDGSPVVVELEKE